MSYCFHDVGVDFRLQAGPSSGLGQSARPYLRRFLVDSRGEPEYAPRMCNLYSLTKGQQAIREMASAMRDITGNLPAFPGIFPDYAKAKAEARAELARRLARETAERDFQVFVEETCADGSHLWHDVE